MIIDINTYCGYWPFRALRDETLDSLDIIGQQSGITHMLVSSLGGIFYKDVHQANRQLYADMQSYRGGVKFLPFAFVNPNYVCWELDMREAIEQFGFCGIELSPKYHGYSLNSPAACEAAKIAASYRIPVRLNAGFENYRQRHHIDTYEDAFTATELTAFVASCPDTIFLINGVTPSTLGDEMRCLLSTRENIFFDITQLDSFMLQTLEAAVNYMGERHLCFGSLAPFQYIHPNLVKVVLSGAVTPEKVFAENIRGYLRVE